ncbi:saccharopine dehydrogenase NADP-binding domain-containing protein [uncultured Gemmiger sp.]|uniref:saccharopine dehydrogenase NADP-binding domain-containing protein n=1 Tax=uncultured Gemmiger sp. TaxID=1623490 RepID=UPI0025EA0686|nr:saccharopine dehydrogenase NADP-binding domain-containing protein [uncultured Gemmiger sp.]
MPYTFCIMGGDARQRAAARALRRAGHTVLGPGQAALCQVLLLPLPAASTPELQAVLACAAPGTLVLAGRPSPQVRQAVEAAGLPLVDYSCRPELAALNAVPTAEGCLALLLEQRDRTLWQSPVLVLGYGRVGQAVARRLAALGAWVTVAARSAEQRAAARCAGCRAAPLTQLTRLLPGFDAVVNTIPAPVLTRTELACLPAGAVVIDLASAPGGTDFAAAADLGLRAQLATGLPARSAPCTAGELLADTVLNILQEREEQP